MGQGGSDLGSRGGRGLISQGGRRGLDALGRSYLWGGIGARIGDNWEGARGSGRGGGRARDLATDV